MKILAIETSCDETALSLLDCEGRYPDITYRVLSNVILSQVEIHKPLGGVVPSLAKREHGRNLIPLLSGVLKDAGLEKKGAPASLDREAFEIILEREPDLKTAFIDYVGSMQKPDIDAIAVTYGPGLEPALWVGINFAKALSLAWGIPVIPVNHMEGHIFSALLEKNKGGYALKKFSYPLLGLLISGGHTEIILSKKWLDYEIVGETRDDAVGEAFDKVARMLELPYPGGPEIAKLADAEKEELEIFLPRPMLKSDDLDFSFSGLKTSVLYFLKKQRGALALRGKIAKEFQRAVTEVLTYKMLKGIKEYKARTVIVGGGVSANVSIKESIVSRVSEAFPKTLVSISPRELTGDNALMIGVAAYARFAHAKNSAITGKKLLELKAAGSLRLA